METMVAGPTTTPKQPQLDLEFNWKDDVGMDHEIWGLSLPFSLS